MADQTEKKNDSWIGTESRRLLGIVLLRRNLIIIAICAVVIAIPAYYLGNQYSNLRQFTLLYNYTSSYVFEVPNPDNESEIMTLGINLRDRVFTEHNTMRVFGLLKPSSNQDHPDSYLVIMNGSNCDTAAENYLRFPDICEIQLTRQSDGTYSGQSVVTYTHNGAYYVSLAMVDGSNPQKILNSRDDYIIADTMQTGNDLQSFRITLNVALLSGAIAIVIGLIAGVVPHVWREK